MVDDVDDTDVLCRWMIRPTLRSNNASKNHYSAFNVLSHSEMIDCIKESEECGVCCWCGTTIFKEGECVGEGNGTETVSMGNGEEL